MDTFETFERGTDECRGCEFCDGEGGHTVADRERQEDEVEIAFMREVARGPR